MFGKRPPTSRAFVGVTAAFTVGATTVNGDGERRRR
jgi:hypothetical protein